MDTNKLLNVLSHISHKDGSAINVCNAYSIAILSDL